MKKFIDVLGAKEKWKECCNMNCVQDKSKICSFENCVSDQCIYKAERV